MHSKYFVVLALTFIAASPTVARADFALSEMIIDIPADAPRQHDVEVISKSKETQYIATETTLVENPGLDNEKRTVITDPQKSGLMVTPNKMVLTENARKIIRLLLLKPVAETDQIYRVAVKPVIQDIVSPTQRMAIKVLIGYETIIIARPKNAKIDLVGERKGTSLTLTNNGNTNANIQYGNQCNALGAECQKIKTARIYAGQTWKTTLPHIDGVVEYEVWDGTTLSTLKF
jgi:Mat/Ecp fimbriae periplasmic chaperone